MLKLKKKKSPPISGLFIIDKLTTIESPVFQQWFDL